jgi:hypothetical protein
MDRKTKTERSLFFLTDIIPVMKAMILTRIARGTVTSHQWSSKESILNTITRITEVPTTVEKKVFSPTDHLPRIVFGATSINWILIANFIKL